MGIQPRKDPLFFVFLLILVTVGIGFFLPVSSGNWLGLVIKCILFILIFLVLYPVFFKTEWIKFSMIKPGTVEEKPPTDTVLEDLSQEGEWKGFGEAFRWYIREFLTVIRSAVVSSYAGFYLQKGEEGLEFQAGESEHGRWDRRVKISEGSLIDQVTKQKSPILEDNLPIGKTLEGLPASKIRSFLGIPLLWEGECVGVLALGGETTESFGEADQDFLIRCGELITQVMALCHRGLRWEMDQEVYHVHLNLEKMLVQAQDEESAVSFFAQEIRKLFVFDRLTLCVKEGEEGIIRCVFGQIDDLDRGCRFSLNEGLTGWVMKRNAPMLLSDMEKGDYVRPRYFRNENSRHGLRSFLGIPLGREDAVWGCLSLESRSVNQYTEKAKEVFTALAVRLYSALERIQLLVEHRELKKG